MKIRFNQKPEPDRILKPGKLARTNNGVYIIIDTAHGLGRFLTTPVEVNEGDVLCVKLQDPCIGEIYAHNPDKLTLVKQVGELVVEDE